ncbi:hypothetical protein [Trueperella pyogenes]|uniref:hypothetical protein n=1 Tax=Trueperella pyogenes TaxID=1661 RepID=UPI00345D0AEF
MNELEFEKLNAVKEEALSALQDEDYLRAEGSLEAFWERIEQWYWREAHPEHVYVADIYSRAVHDAIEEKQGAQAENNAACFTREWVCPYCGHDLQVEYIQKERYLVKCRCKPVRIQYVRATSPDDAAARVGVQLVHVDEWADDLTCGVWWTDNIIEEPPSYVGSPVDDDFPWNGYCGSESFETENVPQPWWGAPLPHISTLRPEDAKAEYDRLSP